EIADHFRLFAGFNIQGLNVLERLLPVVAVTEIPRSLLHLVFAPGHLLVGDGDQFFGRIRNHFRLQLAQQRVAPDWIADDVAGIAGACGGGARSLKTAGALPAASCSATPGSLTRLLSRRACRRSAPQSDNTFA